MAKPAKKRRGAKTKAAKMTGKRVKAPKPAVDAAKARVTDPAIPQVADVAASDDTALARISQLEADRTNLMAQVAWAKGVAQEQQKALEAERERTARLETDLAGQRQRIEQLKALSAWDRFLGRHKGV